MDTKSRQSLDSYKLRLVYVDGEEYGFDDIDLQLVDLKTNIPVAIFTGPEEEQEEYYFTREDFDFY